MVVTEGLEEAAVKDVFVTAGDRLAVTSVLLSVSDFEVRSCLILKKAPGGCIFV